MVEGETSAVPDSPKPPRNKAFLNFPGLHFCRKTPRSLALPILILEKTSTLELTFERRVLFFALPFWGGFLFSDRAYGNQVPQVVVNADFLSVQPQHFFGVGHADGMELIWFPPLDIVRKIYPA